MSRCFYPNIHLAPGTRVPGCDGKMMCWFRGTCKWQITNNHILSVIVTLVMLSTNRAIYTSCPESILSCLQSWTNIVPRQQCWTNVTLAFLNQYYHTSSHESILVHSIPISFNTDLKTHLLQWACPVNRCSMFLLCIVCYVWCCTGRICRRTWVFSEKICAIQ